MSPIAKVQIGLPAPHFNRTAVVDGRLKELSLASYIDANHWVILIFFPKAWSFICPTEIKAFSARLEEFLYSRSCAVLFASTDNEHCLKAWNATSDLEGGLGGVHVPLISDCNQRLAKDYGVLNEEEGTAQRALFIVDPKGLVRGISINDADVGRSVDETLRVLDALNFKEEFGEGCPVDWKKGDKGIDIAAKTSVEGAIELKKSWSEWARPRLNRAWSGTSQRSIGSVIGGNGGSRLRSSSNNGVASPQRSNSGGSGYQSAVPSGQQSPLVSPTSGLYFNGHTTSRMEAQWDEAMMLQKMENLQASLQNQGQTHGISVIL